MIGQLFKTFSESYSHEVRLPHSKELRSFKLLNETVPLELRRILSNSAYPLKIKGSIGAGVNTYFPWVGIFDDRASTGATDGYYVVLLFNNRFDEVYLTLNQGSTKRDANLIESTRSRIYSHVLQVEGFTKGRIPAGGLVMDINIGNSQNGRKYEDSNIFFRKYIIEKFDEEDFIFHLKKIVDIYQSCAVHSNIRIEKENKDMSFLTDTQNSGLNFNDSLISRFQGECFINCVSWRYYRKLTWYEKGRI